MTKKEKKRSKLAQKISAFFEKHEMLMGVVIFISNMIVTLAIYIISREAAYVIGNPDAIYPIAIALLFIIIIVGVIYERRNKSSNTSSKAE